MTVGAGPQDPSLYLGPGRQLLQLPGTKKKVKKLFAMFADIRHLEELTYNSFKFGADTFTDNPAADGNKVMRDFKVNLFA